MRRWVLFIAQIFAVRVQDGKQKGTRLCASTESMQTMCKHTRAQIHQCVCVCVCLEKLIFHQQNKREDWVCVCVAE